MVAQTKNAGLQPSVLRNQIRSILYSLFYTIGLIGAIACPSCLSHMILSQEHSAMKLWGELQ